MEDVELVIANIGGSPPSLSSTTLESTRAEKMSHLNIAGKKKSLAFPPNTCTVHSAGCTELKLMLQLAWYGLLYVYIVVGIW